ncbi:MAG: hypothetical protein JNL82_14740 [Myxococcales bacterium]|nr:hypothetical protein [Myxococcales bacterium]
MDDHRTPLTFNGLDPRTGRYLFAEQTAEDIAAALTAQITGKPDDESKKHAADLAARANTEVTLGPIAGIDPCSIEQSGWCALFPFVEPGTAAAERQQAVLDALKPLLDHRQREAGANYRLYQGPGKGPFRPTDSKRSWLARHGAGPGPADPKNVPYYILIVASPEEIPYIVQYQLDVQYAVGRIHFETVDEYATYARSVVAAETGEIKLAREVATFAVANPDDAATQLSSTLLIDPLVDSLRPLAPDWNFRKIEPANATKATLSGLLHGDDTPAVLFTGSHGLGLPKGDPLQRRHQGALVCGDWPGPRQWRKPFPDDFFFSADDLASSASPHGLIVFNFACYGAGTPRYNDYGQRTGATEREAIADAPFQSALHQRLLGLPRGGALAAIGHVERAWGCSFLWPGTGGRTGSAKQIGVFVSTLANLLEGYPIGAALEYFNQRYAELASDLGVELENISYGQEYDPLTLADMWTANNDARSYAITGDPAVRVHAAPAGGAVKRGGLDPIVVRTAAVAAEPARPAPAEPAPAEPTPVASAPASQPAAAATPATATAPYKNFSPADDLAADITRVFGGDVPVTVRTAVGDELLLTTRIAFNADVDHALSAAADGPASAAVRELHAATVRHAQAHRAALYAALAAIAGKREDR